MIQESLFCISTVVDDVIRRNNTIRSQSVKTHEESMVSLGHVSETVEAVIGTVTMGETIHYASMGEWSSHDLLFHLLDQTGPADVYISTWSVSEDAVRQLIAHIKSGSILRLFGVFDWRVKLRRPEAYELARFNISDIRLTTCHAKVTVIENEAWSISVIGSANYTNNPRIEAGVIACDKRVGDFHKSWMVAEMEQSDPFDTAKRRRK